MSVFQRKIRSWGSVLDYRTSRPASWGDVARSAENIGTCPGGCLLVLRGAEIIVRMVSRLTFLRHIPAALIGYDYRTEHVRSPKAEEASWVETRNSALEHRMGVGRLLRNVLEHVPMLHDPTVLHPVDVDNRRSGIAPSPFSTNVDGREIAVHDHPLDLHASRGLILEQGLDSRDHRIATVGYAGLCWM